MLATGQRVPSTASTIESTLVSLHDRWLNEIRRFVEPAASEGAGFWDRWTAVRYLADQFRDHFRLERALLVSIASLLRPDDVRRLTVQATELERILSELNQAGRRRGTGAAVAGKARRLMEVIAVWCAELEVATAGLRRESLSPEAARVLEHVETSGAVGFP
jgi:hypothetical protein